MAKKKGAKGIIIGIICVIIIAAIVVAVVYFMQGDKKISDLLNIFNKTELTQEQIEEDNKAKEQEQKLLEEIAKDVEDKKPEDIIIPAGATEEEKQELQQEKEYWTVVNDFKDKANEDLVGKYPKRTDNNPGTDSTYSNFKEIRKINNIFIDDYNNVYLLCDYLYDKELNNGDTVLSQCTGLIEVYNEDISISNSSSLSDVIKVLNDKNTELGIDKVICSDYKYLEEFKNNHIYYCSTVSIKEKLGYNCELVMYGNSSENLNEKPREFYALYKYSKGLNIMYDYFSISGLENLSLDEWEDYVVNQKTFDGLFEYQHKSFEALDFNFEELNEKYQQK